MIRSIVRQRNPYTDSQLWEIGMACWWRQRNAQRIQEDLALPGSISKLQRTMRAIWILVPIDKQELFSRFDWAGIFLPMGKGEPWADDPAFDPSLAKPFLELLAYRKEQQEEEPLTIWEARWFGRLYSLLPNAPIERLEAASNTLAIQEWAIVLRGIPDIDAMPALLDLIER